MSVPLLDLTAQYEKIGDELKSVVFETLKSGRYIMGPKVKEFEKNVADYCKVKDSIGVGSGTDALVIALVAAGVTPGDEVITSPFTFFATAEAISNVGGIPVFADIDTRTFNIDPSKIRDKITENTAAIIPVHLYGQCADMDEIMELAKEFELKVIEDACQAIGAEYKGTRAGALGDAGAFSFFPSKNLGAAGDGGMITTDEQQLAEVSRSLRTHGSSKKYYHEMLGYNSRLDALQAGVLNVKLNYLDQWNKQRRENAKYYNQKLAEIRGIETPYEKEGNYHIYHQYTIRVKGKRDRIRDLFSDNGIGFSIYYPLPIHLQDAYSHLGYKKGSFPITELASEEVISLPIYPELSQSQMDEVVQVIKQAMS